MKELDQPIEEVRGKIGFVENKLTKKRREREEKKKANEISINERLIAPALLVITLLISYVILLFS
jgi:hypothetical protein